MASPQLENGYLKIANEIIDALISNRISGQEYQVVLFVIRKTYGFNKKEDYISMGQIAIATGMNRPLVCRILKKLTQKRIIGVTQKDNTVTQKYNRGINCLYFSKDYDNWNVLHKKITVTQKDNRGVTQKVFRGVTQKDTYKRHSTTKDIIKDIYGEFKNVLLTKEEHQKLTDKFGETKALALIERLSAGIASKGYKYKSHYATILNWNNKDEKEKRDPETPQERIGRIMRRGG